MTKLTKKDFKLYQDKSFEDKLREFSKKLFSSVKLIKIYLSNNFYYGDFNLIFHFEKMINEEKKDFIISFCARTKILFSENNGTIPIDQIIKITYPKNINDAMSDYYFYYAHYRTGKSNSVFYNTITVDVAKFILSYSLRSIDLDPKKCRYEKKTLLPSLALKEFLKSGEDILISDIVEEFFKDKINLNYRIHFFNMSYFSKDILNTAILLGKNIKGSKLLEADDKDLYYDKFSYNLVLDKILEVRDNLTNKTVLTESIIELPWTFKVVRYKTIFENDEIIDRIEVDNLFITRREFYLKLNYEEFITVISFKKSAEDDILQAILKNDFFADVSINNIMYSKPVVLEDKDNTMINEVEMFKYLLRKYADVKKLFTNKTEYNIFDCTMASLLIRENEVIIMSNNFNTTNLAVNSFMSIDKFRDFKIATSLHINEPIFFPFLEQLTLSDIVEINFEKFVNDFGIFF